MKPYIYLRALKHADYTVFCVQDGQKTYWDEQFRRFVPFSSGQQVKRSILTALLEDLNVAPSPTTFVAELDKNKKLSDKEPHSSCDPSYVDQLLGGWMMAKAGGTERTLKRRSPLSISAMRALHPLLAGVPQENISFDRTSSAEYNKVIVRNENGKELDEDEILELLKGTDRSLYRRWISDQKRATGLFVYDIAIDLRTLFCVSLNELEPEVNKETIDKLKKAGWAESRNVFGKCLVMPKAQRDKVIPALANALIDWRITSNQARTFSLMETLAIAISDNANTLASTIRAKLIDDGERAKAKPIVDENTKADLYVSLACSNYIVTESESAEAIDKAKEKLINMMTEYNYENQELPEME
ncbi:MAG: CRISPR-associated protein Cas7 [Paludibacteraceae bacterium]|nr:CRISPR-associated protein Cas7 [Paludibacteraceae bacterium]